MKRTVFSLLMCLSCGVSYGAATDDVRVQQLQARVDALQAEYDKKLSELQDCEKKTEGFKIAGITTLATTGVGVFANIKIAEGTKNSGGKKDKARAEITEEQQGQLADLMNSWYST